MVIRINQIPINLFWKVSLLFVLFLLPGMGVEAHLFGTMMEIVTRNIKNKLLLSLYDNSLLTYVPTNKYLAIFQVLICYLSREYLKNFVSRSSGHEQAYHPHPHPYAEKADRHQG